MNTGRASSKNLIFEVTRRCNADCKYCYNVWKNGGSYPDGELSTRDIKRILKKALRESNASFVTLTGGEPLIRKDLEQIIKFLKRLNSEVNIITNATLLNEERIKRIVDLGVNLFEVPLLSGRREIQNGLMRIDAFDSVTEAIVKIKKHKGRVVTVFVATKENIQCFEETVELAFALGSDGIMLNRFNPGGEGAKYIKELLPSAEQVRGILEIAENFSEKYNLEISCSIPLQPCLVDIKRFKKVRFGFCSAGTDNSYYTIDPLGNLRMCNHSRLILGNLFKESFQDLISKETALDFVSGFPESCEVCGEKNICLGGCKAAAEVCFGSFQKEEPFLRMNKEILMKSDGLN